MSERSEAAERLSLDEAELRRFGFTGPTFDLDRLQLDYGEFRLTFYQGWNFWRATGPRGYRRVADDVKTFGELRRLLGLELQETRDG